LYLISTHEKINSESKERNEPEEALLKGGEKEFVRIRSRLNVTGLRERGRECD
jgi:hypothetical protein